MRYNETRPELLELLRLSVEKFNNMTPEEKEAMYKAQRESWVRGNMPTGDPRFD